MQHIWTYYSYCPDNSICPIDLPAILSSGFRVDTLEWPAWVIPDGVHAVNFIDLVGILMIEQIIAPFIRLQSWPTTLA